ncbi:uroporphyrinogen-III synthase [bacterium LRH843]|nr:uroporphyrinogen-III synthase [bacterium LRH843]
MSELPLAGKTVLVTRAKEQAPALSALIQKQGGTALEVPLLAFQRSKQEDQIDQALKHIADYDWLIFTSVNGVHFFMERYNEMYKNDSTPPVKIAVVGEKTEAALLNYNIKTDVMPLDYSAEGMVDVLVNHIHAGDKVLLARGNLGRNVLNVALAKIGAHLDDLTLYKTVYPGEAKSELHHLIENRIPVDYVTFTSSSTVSHYVNIMNQFDRENAHFKPKIACIGPIAAKTAADLGLTVDIIPLTYTIEELVEQLVIDTKKEENAV